MLTRSLGAQRSNAQLQAGAQAFVGLPWHALHAEQRGQVVEVGARGEGQQVGACGIVHAGAEQQFTVCVRLQQLDHRVGFQRQDVVNGRQVRAHALCEVGLGRGQDGLERQFFHHARRWQGLQVHHAMPPLSGTDRVSGAASRPKLPT